MFCRQCEQTQDHHACVTTGVCGKTAETSATQDALVAQIKSVAHWMVAAAKTADFERLKPIHTWTLAATFSTLTNVNFSSDRIAEFIQQGEAHKATLKGMVDNPPSLHRNAQIDLSGKDVSAVEEFGLSVSVPKRSAAMGHDDAFSLNEVTTYGLKVQHWFPHIGFV